LPIITGFAGCATQLSVLTDLLEKAVGAGDTILISAGGETAGIGETTLTAYWARRVDRFPDGQLYVNLRGFDATGAPTTSTEAIRGFLIVFDVPEERNPVSLDHPNRSEPQPCRVEGIGGFGPCARCRPDSSAAVRSDTPHIPGSTTHPAIGLGHVDGT
jgi:hypothetical protein